MKGFKGTAELDASLVGCDVVVIPAGVPRKPGSLPPLSRFSHDLDFRNESG